MGFSLPTPAVGACPPTDADSWPCWGRARPRRRAPAARPATTRPRRPRSWNRTGRSRSPPARSGREPIPERYVRAGENVSPPLSFEGVPGDASRLALVVDDPEAGETPFVHWLLWDVEARRTTLAEGVPRGVGRVTAYALDRAPDLNPGIDRTRLE